MSGVSLPVTRPIGRALVVANPSGRASLVELLTRLGFDCSECDDPYQATLELTRRRMNYRALVISLASFYREELPLIGVVKRRFPHIEIWLGHSDGRQAALAEAVRLGADGLVDEEGPHRIAAAVQPVPVYEPLQASMSTMALPPMPETQSSEPEGFDSTAIGEPVLSAEELRALLHDQTAMPPSGGEDHG